MKSALFTIFAGAVCAAMTATATDATSVRVTLNAKGSSTKIEKLGMPQTFGFPGQGLTSQPITPWQVVNIPVQIEAKAKGDDSAHFVSQLTFKAHLLVEAGDKRVVLSKEITYVDIPLSGSGDVTKTEMSVGVFIPPSTAIRLNKKGKGDLKGKLLGVAIETEFNGIRKDGERVVDPQQGQHLHRLQHRRDPLRCLGRHLLPGRTPDRQRRHLPHHPCPHACG